MDDRDAGPLAETSVQLARRAREGDRQALNVLVERCLPPLRRWTSGRLPRWARELVDTDDLLQDTLLRSLRHLDTLDLEREGAFLAYLRKAVQNRIREEIRRIRRHPQGDELDAGAPDPGPSPLEEAIGHEALERYESALESLHDDERHAIVARVEMGIGYEELAAILGKPSPDAARMAVSRALVRLAESMRHERHA